MFYLVTDRNDAGRTSFIIDSFTNRTEADKFSAEWSADNGTSKVEECETVDQIADMNDLFNEIELRFKNQTGALRAVDNDGLATAIASEYSFAELKERYEVDGMEAIYCFA